MKVNIKMEKNAKIILINIFYFYEIINIIKNIINFS